MPNNYPPDSIFDLHFKTIKDSYNIQHNFGFYSSGELKLIMLTLVC